ncbi:C40 family peptidase [Patescibacteria group bacterium]
MGILREQKGLYWMKPAKSVVTVWCRPLADPGKLNARARHRNIQTQINPQDLPVKVLAERPTALLIQMADLTRGFVLAEEMRPVPTKNYWRQVKRFGPKLVAAKFSRVQMVKILKQWPRTKYVWGGRSGRGLDCSAAVQAAVYRFSDHWLPRNSCDQGRKGRQVSRLAVGDLVLFKSRTKKFYHIGIVVDSCRGQVWHQSRRHNRPAIEDVTSMQKRYRLLDVRRILKFND